MGCPNSTLAHTRSQPSEPDTACYPVPFGHVPYTPALPGAMGPLWDFPIEWWYYGGWATGLTETKKFTILMQTIRISPDPTNTSAAILYGIGTETPGSFVTHSGYGSGQFPPPTSTSWSMAATMKTMQSTMTCKLTSGILGLSGATYQLDMNDTTNSVSASFILKDTFGMILEGASGAFHKAGGECSYEFAMPSLTIEKGSTITMNGKTTKLGGGNLWLDRQTISPGSSSEQRFISKSVDSKPLYTGNWLAVNMNDRTVYNMVFFWPKEKEQWKVGTELTPAVDPIYKIGLEYPSLANWDGRSHPPAQGVYILEQGDFDLNILEPKNPNQSPHWKSPESKQTYCTAWKLKIKDKHYTMTAWVPGSEVNLGTYFFEGAASIRDEADHEVGCAFVEQMGYN